jgi:hypothetical protein
MLVRVRLAPAVRIAALTALAATVVLSLPHAATGHLPRACVVPTVQRPMGDTGRVYAIPHGCVRLVVPPDESKLPTVVVRQHDERGRVFARRVPLREANLDRANGSIGLRGHDSTYLFFVAYPFLSVVAHDLYDLGDGRRECALEVDRALLGTGRLSAPPSLRLTWYTHRSPG